MRLFNVPLVQWRTKANSLRECSRYRDARKTDDKRFVNTKPLFCCISISFTIFLAKRFELTYFFQKASPKMDAATTKTATTVPTVRPTELACPPPISSPVADSRKHKVKMRIRQLQ